jgi:wyosine [tRNA(Phe)-imidazoG37] synthetase (radical SAM superfamily)
MTGGRPHVYGPVPSRRFGLSLGVDLVPFKTCTYDCIYCQLGRTTDLTVDRRDFYPVEEILEDVRGALERGPRPDVVTLAGSGEPTLYRSLGRVIRGIRRLTDVPILLLTNGSLLHRDDVAADALEADLVAPSLDAGDEATFRVVNRPHPSLSFETMVSGLGEFCRRFRGKVRLEVMLVRSRNDRDDDLRAIASHLSAIRHDAVDVNTVVRPSRSAEAERSGEESLARARSVFGPGATVIAGASAFAERPRRPDGAPGGAEQEVLALLSRRPATTRDLEAALGLHPAELVKILDRLLSTGRVATRRGGRDTFFVALPARPSES